MIMFCKITPLSTWSDVQVLSARKKAPEPFLLLLPIPGEVLLGIRGRGLPLGSPNPDPISDQNMPFSIPVFRPGL